MGGHTGSHSLVLSSDLTYSVDTLRYKYIMTLMLPVYTANVH